ncbi:MAG TPA: methyl-accepting chemotaxis protein [Caproiciproducens sp.]|nr:methyl-accepting chemotaxis protein [Caproiciproducens sp.]
MKNFKIAKKLIYSFLIVSLITTIVGVSGIVSLVQMKNSSTKLYEKQTVPLPVISDIILNLDRLRGQGRDFILYCNDQDKIKEIENKMETYKAFYQTDVKQYGPTIATAASKKLFDEANQMYEQQMLPALDNVIKQSKSGNSADALKSLDDFKTINQKVVDNYTQCMQNRVSNAKLTNQSNTQLADMMLIISAAIMVAGIIISILLGMFIARSLSRPINQMAVAAERIAQGSLDVEITYVSKDEIGSLARSLKSASETLKLYIQDISDNLGLIAEGDLSAEINQEYVGDFQPIKQAFQKISDDLNETMSTIDISAEQVSSGASQVSGGAQELAQGATEQASTIEELAAATTEVSNHIKENAEHVRTVTGYVEETISGVNRGTGQMKNMLVSMDNINSSSSEIGKIIKVIDDIAFQTNILALNAAVEAARAGAAGKGFAVVADEVRNLASKSAEAAKHTTQLIETSVQNIREGSDMATKTAAALDEIAAKVHLVGETVERIDRASSNQATAIAQITQGVEQVSSVVQTNSATAEESAAASEELSAQAETLSKLVGKFKLKLQS